MKISGALKYLSQWVRKLRPKNIVKPKVPQSSRAHVFHSGGPSLRPDTDGFVLRSEDFVASRRISRQIADGKAYFARYQFSTDPEHPSLANAHVAAQDLARRAPQLDVVTDAAPDVSIIIPVYGQLHFVLNCLDSLAVQSSRFSVEILVVDDATPPELQMKVLQDISWVRYIRRTENGGFVTTCNQAAAQARGRYLLFLNSDIRVADCWLDELIGSFSIFLKAGLIGSKLYNEDGSLQDAGGIFWREGTAWNYGRDDDGDHPKYGFARRADYCSGASIALPVDIWKEMGGFDELFMPAYCEDADLAFRLRAAGYEVWLQSLSCALHYEGRTHGRDLNAGMKAYQVVNMKKFYDRWKAALSLHGPDAQFPNVEADRQAKKRLLVLDAETPTPDRDCGSVFVMKMLTALQALGYQVTFAPHFTYFFDGPYTNDLQRRGIECLYGPYFGGIDDIMEFRKNFDLVLAYRHYVLSAVYDTIRLEMPLARVVFSNVDLHYLREEREAELLDDQRARNAAMMTKSAELEILSRADCAIVHTEFEAQVIRQRVALENIVELPYIAEPRPSSVSRDDRFDIMFLGGFRHIPNVDAMLHFTGTIWPKLLKSLPDSARLLIVGASPPQEIQDLASERVVVTGFVEDLAPWFDAARVFIAPLRFGAGIKGKVIESLRHGTPCVATSIAAEGIGMTSGMDALVVDNDEAFKDAVLQAYEDSALWHALQSAGYDLVRKRFSPSRFEEVCATIVKTADTTWMRRQERALSLKLEILCEDQCP